MAEKSTVDSANASHNEKDVIDTPPGYEVERNGSTARRKSVALNIVENPLKVSQRHHSYTQLLIRSTACLTRAKRFGCTQILRSQWSAGAQGAFRSRCTSSKGPKELRIYRGA